MIHYVILLSIELNLTLLRLCIMIFIRYTHLRLAGQLKTRRSGLVTSRQSFRFWASRNHPKGNAKTAPQRKSRIPPQP